MWSQLVTHFSPHGKSFTTHIVTLGFCAQKLLVLVQVVHFWTQQCTQTTWNNIMVIWSYKHLMTIAEIVQSWQILLSPRHLGHRELSVKHLTMKSACLNVILFIQQEYKHYFLTTVDTAIFSLTKIKVQNRVVNQWDEKWTLKIICSQQPTADYRDNISS